MIRDCSCENWRFGKSEEDRLATLAWAHGQDYRGPVWHYCPWCGQKLELSIKERLEKVTSAFKEMEVLTEL
jgi:hypothetical protein